MDSKIVRRGVAGIIIAVILIFALVYVTNADRFARRSSSGTSTAVSAGEDNTAVQSAYGLRIGDDLKAFLSDPDFFDPVGEETQTVTEEDVIAVHPSISAEDGVITIRVVDAQDRLVSGASFTIVLSRVPATGRNTDMTFTDTDRDGLIRIEGLSAGSWRMRFQAIDGYRVPDEETQITIEDQQPEDATQGTSTGSVPGDDEQDTSTGSVPGDDEQGTSTGSVPGDNTTAEPVEAGANSNASEDGNGTN